MRYRRYWSARRSRWRGCPAPHMLSAWSSCVGACEVQYMCGTTSRKRSGMPTWPHLRTTTTATTTTILTTASKQALRISRSSSMGRARGRGSCSSSRWCLDMLHLLGAGMPAGSSRSSSSSRRRMACLTWMIATHKQSPVGQRTMKTMKTTEAMEVMEAAQLQLPLLGSNPGNRTAVAAAAAVARSRAVRRARQRRRRVCWRCTTTP
mmetsp:Transcript_19905/g.43325  ORF Transcript_19905/g.43325 Transcript_19905/m.43325 type:complete len:207 (-) Transcript_19905:100-720(-)